MGHESADQPPERATIRPPHGPPTAAAAGQRDCRTQSQTVDIQSTDWRSFCCQSGGPLIVSLGRSFCRPSGDFRLSAGRPFGCQSGDPSSVGWFSSRQLPSPRGVPPDCRSCRRSQLVTPTRCRLLTRSLRHGVHPVTAAALCPA